MMIATLIDSLIQPFSPKWALQRAVARRRIELLGDYAAGRRDRTNRDFNPANGSADSELFASRELMNARARASVRDNPHAAAVARSIKRRVVGMGITPAPTVK